MTSIIKSTSAQATNTGATRNVRDWIWHSIDMAPVLLPATIATFGSVATLLLLCGQLKNIYVWPFGLLVAISATIIITRYYQGAIQDKERRLCNVFIGVGAVIWGLFNTLFNAQHLITNRDPGTYANAGLWLINHTSLRITTPTVFGNASNVTANSLGFSSYTLHGHTYLYAQGLHLLPIFLGLAGRIVGVRYMFDVNILFGMTALLAIYALGRLLVRPFWAATATTALAVSMPFLYFSRDTYTEPLAATCTFGALALLFLALRTKRPSLWLLVGIITGVGTLTRVDGFLTIAAMLLFAVILLATTTVHDRIVTARSVAALCIGMVVTATLGWLDLWTLSRSYYEGIAGQFWCEMGLIAAILICGAIFISLSWRTQFLSRLDGKTRSWRNMAAVTGVIGLALILASQPLWTFGMKSLTSTAAQWVVWYAGPLLGVLCVGGTALVAARITSRKRPLLLATFLVVFITSLVYIADPSVSPDQVWGARRLVPVILPGLNLFGIMVVDWIDQQYSKELETRWRYACMALASAAIVLGPLLTARPDIVDHDTDLLSPVMNICKALPSDSAVLWLDAAQGELIQPTRSICNVPALGYYNPTADTVQVPTIKELALIARNAKANDYKPIIGIFGSDSSILTASEQQRMTTVTAFDYEALATPIGSPPVSTHMINNSIELGTITATGAILPL